MSTREFVKVECPSCGVELEARKFSSRGGDFSSTLYAASPCVCGSLVTVNVSTGKAMDAMRKAVGKMFK